MDHNIIKAIIKNGGHPLAVGGFVRDSAMGLNPKDIDIEVHSLDADALITILRQFGKVDVVGASFGVIKLWTDAGDFDFSLPRRENKIGKGHKGFQVAVDSTMTIAEAAARRDFTINSMALSLMTNELIDIFNGMADLTDGVLRHTSAAFSEDPLRVLRGMQFAGRFNMVVADETAELCVDMIDEFHSLAQERIWGEWCKWAEKSVKPSAGLKFLMQTDWVTLFPDLNALIDLQQDPEWHPEGSVWRHTMHVVDAMDKICRRDGITGDQRVMRMFGALCHDFGKASTTIVNDVGRWVSPSHAQAGEEPTLKFLKQIGMPVHMQAAVVEMVREHMVHVDFNGAHRTVRRLLSRLKHADITDVMAVIEADHSGRPPLPAGMPESATKMMEIVIEIGKEVKPILMGRHLIDCGVEPGVEMGNMLKAAFEAQLDGEFDNVEAAKIWLFHNILEKGVDV